VSIPIERSRRTFGVPGLGGLEREQHAETVPEQTLRALWRIFFKSPVRSVLLSPNGTGPRDERRRLRLGSAGNGCSSLAGCVRGDTQGEKQTRMGGRLVSVQRESSSLWASLGWAAGAGNSTLRLFRNRRYVLYGAYSSNPQSGQFYLSPTDRTSRRNDDGTVSVVPGTDAARC